MIEEQLESLNAICKNLDKSVTINSGGCCFVAYVLASLCEKYNLKYVLVVRDHCGCFDEEVFYECINNRDECDCVGLGDDTCNHYYLEIEGTLINSDGDFDKENDHLMPNVDSNDLKWIYNTGSWNDVYGVSENKHVKETLTKWFDENFSKRR